MRVEMISLTKIEDSYLKNKFFIKLKEVKQKVTYKILNWKKQERDYGFSIKSSEKINFHIEETNFSKNPLKIKHAWITNKPLRIETLNDHTSTSWESFEPIEMLDFNIGINDLPFWAEHLEDHLYSDLLFYFFKKEGNEKIKNLLKRKKRKPELDSDLIKRTFIDTSISFESNFNLSQDYTIVNYKNGMIYPVYQAFYEKINSN